MSECSYTDYISQVEKAQSNRAFNRVKLGYFKLDNDGDEAIVRFNISSPDDIKIGKVHEMRVDGKFMKIGCLNPVASNNGSCPLCEAAKTDKSLPRAKVKAFIPLLVSYKDAATGTWAEPVAVIWERPESFSKIIAGKLRDYGDLRQILMKVVRIGKAGDTNTTYSVDYAMPTIYKPDMIPEDFSAFDGISLVDRCTWKKTAEEIQTYVETGSFPAVQTKSTPAPAPAPSNTFTAPDNNPPFDMPYQTTEPKSEPAQRNFSANKFSF